MKSRLLVAAAGVPALLYVALWGPEWLLAVSLAVLAGVGAAELMRCVGARSSGLLCRLTVYCAVWAALCGWCLPEWLVPSLTLYCLLAFAAAVWKAGEIKTVHLLAGIFGAILIPYAFSSFFRIHGLGGHRGYLLLPFILSFACDTFAYFTGLTIGRHKLAPKVSPKKTVEGSIGGLVGNVICGLAFAYVMNRWFGGSIHYGSMALLALFCGVVAQIGDLSFSLIKREFGIKDYGRIFLAHCGVLDRFDSVLFVAPTLAALMQILGIR